MNVQNEYWYSNQDESIHQISKYEPKNTKYHSKQKKHKKDRFGEMGNKEGAPPEYFPLLFKIFIKCNKYAIPFRVKNLLKGI